MAPAFVIVGANLTGGMAAATLRAEGFDGGIVLVGAEPVPPYERPPLSKAFLRGEVPFEASLLRPPEFWEQQGIDTRFGQKALRIDTVARGVELDGGASVSYDKVLVATGLRNRSLTVAGAGLEGVHSLRTVKEAESLKAEIVPGATAVVVGMGFIGAEVAATLRMSGVAVEAVEPFPAPCYRGVGPLTGGVLAEIHREHGVVLHLGESLDTIEGTRRVEAVVTSAGRRIPCDFVVVGVGTAPLTGVVEGTAVLVNNGVVTDEFCRTNVDGIYAAGDVANHYHPLYRRHIRVEHWQNALKQGAAAARSMLGREQAYAEVPWFWSDQYDVNIQSAGLIPAEADGHEVVIRGDVEARRYVVYYLSNDRILGAVGLNNGRDLRRSMALMASEAVVDRLKLADVSADVRAAVQA